jgi:cytoskeletal protein CcmA (bactofilin family)
MPPRRLRPARRAAAFAALGLIALSTGVVLAADEALDGKLRSGETITIESGETVAGDLYAVGGTVFVDGTVEGDLVAAGGDIRVNGTVGGDLVAAGGTVTVAGTVDGDARIASGQITVTGDIGEDLLVAGGQATLGASGSVGEDLIASAGQLTVAGAVEGSIQGGAGTYERSGTVGGDENVAVGDPGEEEAERDDAVDDILDAVEHYLVVLLVGGLALWLAPRTMRAAAEAVRRRPLAALGTGLLAFLGWLLGIIGVVVVVILIAIISGLIGFGELAGLAVFAGAVLIVVAAFAFFVIVSYLADAIVGLAIASFARPGSTSRWMELALLAVGAAIVVALTSLPVVGGVIQLVVAVLGLGALTLAIWSPWRDRRSTVRTEPLPPAV